MKSTQHENNKIECYWGFDLLHEPYDTTHDVSYELGFRSTTLPLMLPRRPTTGC